MEKFARSKQMQIILMLLEISWITDLVFSPITVIISTCSLQCCQGYTFIVHSIHPLFGKPKKQNKKTRKKTAFQQTCS